MGRSLTGHRLRDARPAGCREREGRPIATQLSQLSLDDYVKRLRRTKLIAPQELAAQAERAGQSAERLSENLIRSQKLTAWQQEHILAGRLHGFFLGKYKLLSRIGCGGMGAIYLAEHTLMRRRVAIKVLPKDRVREASYLERFRREARAIASLDHPNIIHAYHIDNDGDIHYLVLEYVDGVNLETLVQQRGPLPILDAVDYIRQAADGLAHAHARGLVHRDIKPSNLLVDKTGTIKVLDLGLARLDDPENSITMEHKERVLGTADYLSPEQALDSHAVDHRADLYSLGCTLYFLLTGRAPFPGGTLAERLLRHQMEQPRPLTELRADVPVGLAAICWRMLAKHPENRYRTADEASQALVAWRREHWRTNPEEDTQSLSKSDTNIRRFDQAPPRPPAVLPAKPGQSSPGSPSPGLSSLSSPLGAKPASSLSGSSSDAPWPWASSIASQITAEAANNQFPNAAPSPPLPPLPPLNLHAALGLVAAEGDEEESFSGSGDELRSFLGVMSRRAGPSASYQAQAHRNANLTPAMVFGGVMLAVLIGVLLGVMMR